MGSAAGLSPKPPRETCYSARRLSLSPHAGWVGSQWLRGAGALTRLLFPACGDKEPNPEQNGPLLAQARAPRPH